MTDSLRLVFKLRLKGFHAGCDIGGVTRLVGLVDVFDHPVLNRPVSNKVRRAELLHNPQLLKCAVEKDLVLVPVIRVVFRTRRLNPHLAKFEEEAPETSHGPLPALGPNLGRAREPRTRPVQNCFA